MNMIRQMRENYFLVKIDLEGRNFKANNDSFTEKKYHILMQLKYF